MLIKRTAENINLPGVARKHTYQEDLADYVRRVMKEKELTHRQVETQSKRDGSQGIAHSYISKIISRSVSNLSTEKLKALAKGLQVSEDEVFARARGQKPDPIAESNKLLEAAHKFDALPELKRPAVEPLIDILNRELDRLAREED